MGVIHGANRHEASLFPARLDDSMAAEHPVRFLDAVVAHLARTALGLQRAPPAATGWPAYDPADLLKLSIYGSLDRLRSRRRLAQATHRQVALLWRVKKRRPDHKPVADCRQHNLKPRRQGCREGTVWGQPLARCAGARVALAGRKLRAVNAQAHHCTPDQLTQRLTQIDQRLAGDLHALDGQDTRDAAGTPGGAVADHGQANMEALPHRQLLSPDLQAP
jgi:transposase